MKIDGRKLAEQIRQSLKVQVEKLKNSGVTPHLAVVLIGNNPASLIYIGQKRIQAEKVGVTFSLHQFSQKTLYKDVFTKIKQLATDPTIHGLIVQRPIPPPFSNELTNLVPKEKDVDGFLPDSPFDPPVALAVVKMLKAIYSSSESQTSREVSFKKFQASSNNKNTNNFHNWLRTKKIVIIGRGETAGKPIANLFSKYNIPFSVIHSQTTSRDALLKSADIVVSCVGKPNTVNASQLKKNVILIGIGLTSVNGKLVGDYDETDIESVASYYTPNPGGTGPVNVASLIENVVKAALH